MNQELDLRTLVWNSLLDADLNFRYFGRLASRFHGYDRGAKIFVAITTSSAVSGWAIWGRPGVDWIWQVLSALSAVVSLALPILDPSRSLRTSSSLKGAWFSILKDYELLWSEMGRMSEDEERGRWAKIIDEEKRLAELDSTIRRRPKLVIECQNEVCRSRGLPDK